MNKDNDKRSRLRLPQVSGVVRETSTSAAAAAAPPIAFAARNSIVNPSRNAAPKPAAARRFKLGRNRASPARLFKLNKILVPAQKDLIEAWGWGGMLKVVAKEMPVDLSMWVLSCFDPIRSELAIPGRGSIPVTADSYTRIFGIRNEGMPVCYEMETEPIKFMNEEYGIESGSAPDFVDWCKMISDMGGAADMKFLRAYFAGVISCFVSPTTSPTISPRCYTSLFDLNQFRRLNFAQFAIDQIIAEVKKMGVKKKSVCCCLHHLVILYLDSLVVDEPVATDEECPIRAAAWNDRLIQNVMHKDSKGNGEFGKLRLKETVGATLRDSLFVGMTRTEEFVSSKLPRKFASEKKRKIAVIVGELCIDISNRLGTFVESFANLMDEEQEGRRKRQREDAVVHDEDDGDDEGGDDNNGERESEEDSDGEDDEDDDTREDEDDDNRGDEDDPDGRNDNHSTGGTGEDEQHEDPASKLQPPPRRSARLTPKKSHDGPSSNLRKRPCDNVDDNNGGVEDDANVRNNNHSTGGTGEDEQAKHQADDLQPPPRRSARLTPQKSNDGPSSNLRKTPSGNETSSDDLSVQGLIQRTRRKAGEEHLVQLHTDQEHDKDDAPNVSDWSPFSELRELVGLEIRCGIDLPYIEPPEIFDNDSRLHAKAVFMSMIHKDKHSSLESDPPLTTFGSDEAIQKLTAECFNLHRLDIQGEEQKQKSFRQKQVVHRERPFQNQKRSRLSANDTGKSTIPVTLQTEPAKAKVSSNIPEGTTNLPMQNKHVTVAPNYRVQANVEARGAAKLKMPTVMPPKPNQQHASSGVIRHQQNPQVAPHCAVPPMPPSRVLEESNHILPEPTKASTMIADGTSNMQKRNKHVTAFADARAEADVDVLVAANHKIPTARPPQAKQLQPASSRGTEHQQIPQVMPHYRVSPTKVIEAPQKHAPLPQGIPANREATCPTRESCPPPEPKIKNLDEVTRKRAMLARAPDAPSFDLGFDSPAKFDTNPPYSCGITPVDLDAERFGSEVDDWDESTWKEACEAVDKVEREKGYRQEQPTTDNSNVLAGSGFKTPVGTVNNIASSSQAEGSTTAAERPEEKRRRLIRQAICQLSPYITYEDKSLFTCSAEVKELYNAVIAHGRRSTRGKEIDKSPIIVNYERFFVSLKELANAMMPCGVVSNTVMELGIESIMLRKDRNVKKIVMPLRVTHLLKDLKRNEKELKKHFNKATAHLDRKDSVMLPVIEDLAPEADEPVYHYWLFVINIRDRRFEVLDSIRSLSDRKLAQNVEDILSAVHTLWDQYYANSPVKLSRFEGPEDIKPPKQGTNTECGICTLFNAEHWNGRKLPNYSASHIPNIRKKMTHTWVTSVKNTVKWKAIIMKKK